MSTVVTDGVQTRHKSVSQDPSQNVVLTLNEVQRQNRARRAALIQGMTAVLENQGPSSESTGNMVPGVISEGSPVTLGRDVWNEVFQGYQFVLPNTDFMKCLEELLSDVEPPN